MDNPFAQTNAAHLLKPLMDMAKKTNTQLICFTGLGGESIYSRFDNIYVLNLIAASLRQGMQYLRADHMRRWKYLKIPERNEPDNSSPGSLRGNCLPRLRRFLFLCNGKAALNSFFRLKYQLLLLYHFLCNGKAALNSFFQVKIPAPAATSLANAISWVTITMVVFCSASSFMTLRTSPVSSGSKAEVGSSKQRISGSVF